MAWQSLSSMGSGGTGGGNGSGDPSQQANQPQGTEYTLQGKQRHLEGFQYLKHRLITIRCDALLTDRMAQA